MIGEDPSASDLNYLYSSLNQNLIHDITYCFRFNKLALNVTKTNYMLFTNSLKYLPELQININDQLIEKSEFGKLLGIYIDDKLKLGVHINNIKSHLSSSLYAINKIKHLYYSMVYPYLMYGITQWGPHLEPTLTN